MQLMRRLADSDEEHQRHLDILAGSDEIAARKLMAEIQHSVHSDMHFIYMYPQTIKMINLLEE